MMMRIGLYVILGVASMQVHADAIGRYMNIASNIPKMEMKADPEAQAWARSARNILALTSETIAESLMLANASATQRGTPLFCLPENQPLNSTDLNLLIQQTYHTIYSPESEKDTMTVSQVALMGVTQKYPCTGVQAAQNRTPSTGLAPGNPGMLHVN